MTHEQERCQNCGAPLAGPYCAECGQKGGGPELSVRKFFGSVLEDIVSLDSRVARTLIPLVTRPGEITARYLEGERIRYVPPVRLYIFVSLGYFLLLGFWMGSGAGSDQDFVQGGDPREMAEEILRQQAEEGTEALSFSDAMTVGAAQVAEDPAAFRRSLAERLSHLMFFLLPAFAVLSWLLYRRRERYLLPHLLHALHFHVFAYLVLGAAILLVWTGIPFLRVAGEFLPLGIPVYLFLSLRRVYGGRWWTTALRATLLLGAYGVLLSVSLIALVFLGVLRA
jgi:hypothetical protein